MQLETGEINPSHLTDFFHELNKEYFNSELPLPVIRWNTRLRSSAGRFIPSRKMNLIFFSKRVELPPAIEIAYYLKNHKDSLYHIKDTIAHEMIHYWLWYFKKPYGHTAEFKKKMREMGVSRYNSVPLLKKHKYKYACPQCEQEFFAKKKWKASACLRCCKKYNNGIFHVQFKLYLKEEINNECK